MKFFDACLKPNVFDKKASDRRAKYRAGCEIVKIDPPGNSHTCGAVQGRSYYQTCAKKRSTPTLVWVKDLDNSEQLSVE